jgi:hypothetical protein
MRKPRVRRHEVVQPLDESYRLIPLTQGKNAIVDATDYEWIKQWNWCSIKIGNNTYASAFDGKKNVYMHRKILNPKKGLQVDHINRNGLDNRRENLRQCSRAENSWNTEKPVTNTSGFKGVYWDKSRRKWLVLVKKRGKCFSGGRFTLKEQAIESYNELVRKHHGEFALLNPYRQ